MSHIGQQIEFSSPAFPPCKEDEELVNHEIMHGYALARYVADHLSRHGFEVLRMVAGETRRPEAHDQQHGRVLRIAEPFVGDIELAGTDVLRELDRHARV